MTLMNRSFVPQDNTPEYKSGFFSGSRAFNEGEELDSLKYHPDASVPSFSQGWIDGWTYRAMDHENIPYE